MEAVVWIVLPVLVALGASLLTFYVMQARGEVALAQEREALTEARVRLESNKRTAEESIRATEESTRRKAFDEFLGDVRIEERHYVREQKQLFRSKKSLVIQERLFFRNIPLSNWVEQELVVEQTANLTQLAERISIFGKGPAVAESPPALIQHVSARKMIE